MEISHYFLGNEVLVVTVEHGKMERRSHIDSAANRHAMELIGNLLPREIKANVSLRSNESKKSAETGDPISVYTYDIHTPVTVPAQKK